MFSPHMPAPTALLHERLPAMLAFKATIVHMDPHMLSQGLQATVRLVTHFAFELPHSRVLHAMAFQLRRGKK